MRRISYSAIRERSNRLSGALESLGLESGDRVGTLGWNTQHHFEMYYAVMGAGYVCHTLNPRFTAAQLTAVINEAEDRIVAVAPDLLPLLVQVVPACPSIEHVIIMDGGSKDTDSLEGSAHVRLWSIESILLEHGAPIDWGEFDEETAAGLCYTSGTTGLPKGVLYTHRSNYLHTLRALQADAMAITGGDVILIAVPMFHANGWGLPFAAPAVGASIVLPGRITDGAGLARLLIDERVTVAVGMHTVWIRVADYLDSVGGDLPHLKRVLIGGAKCPDALIQRLEERLGIQVQTSWGMTELSPLGTIATPGAQRTVSGTSGRPPLGLDIKLTDSEGNALDHQRDVIGHLWVKGASVVDCYYKDAAGALDDEGYFDTGDLATIDADGNLTISGRSKDLIKSGGEWINPAEIEDIIGRHPSVGQVAVIGRPDEKWGERPVLVVEPRSGKSIDSEILVEEIRGKVANWWIPDRVALVSSMPLASTGKIDKNQLRADFAELEIDGE